MLETNILVMSLFLACHIILMQLPNNNLLIYLALALLLALLTLVVLSIRNIRFRKQVKIHLNNIGKIIDSVKQKEFEHRLSENLPVNIGALAHKINLMLEHLEEDYKNLEIRVIRRTSEISMRNAELRKKQREILQQNHELKSAYDALKESREKYEKLIQHLEDEYIFYSQAPNGILLFVSPSVKKILGYTTKDFRNKYIQLYTDNPINKTARVKSKNSRQGIQQSKYISEIFDSKESPRILEISEVPIFNDEGKLVSVEGLAHDITERQKAEEIIKEQEEKYRMLFTHASDVIFLYEIDRKKKEPGRIIEANNYTLEKLGYTIEELRNMTPTDLIAVEIWEDKKESMPEYIANDEKYERIWESKEGKVLDFEISSHGFKIKNRHVAIVVARDITERKKNEEEIRFVNEELYNQKENLEALVDNLTQTQEQLVQSEKMAALGQLIAGIAHEINTPLGAIKASIGNLLDSLNNALEELPVLFHDQSEENLKLFAAIFEQARKKHPDLSSREKRQKKRDHSSKLKEEKIENADVLADILTYLEIYEITTPLLNLFRMPNALQVVRSARNFISLLRNTNTINIAVEKATKVVFALKKYSHRDTAGDKVSTDVTDSIDTVLTLYHNQLKQGIELVTNYQKLPLVQCYRDEISQVWTNLIQNAIQAMKQEGTLTIATRHEGDYVSVSFKDTGPGIEPDIKDKIFEPFYTTKKQGEGSGLGLDIVKKIIDKHKGTILVDSNLGEGANFIIKIPVN
jgi:two-component system, NtrC family, sensor kinase